MTPDATRPWWPGIVAWRMGLIQHKREAYWFYRFLSLGYDRWVNPLFWTTAMRARALEAARLDAPGLDVLDAGAGTGFTTEGIVERVDPARVTMLDQSPHQLARARRKPALAACRKELGDAERLPFEDGTFDRYVSAGSIEYWPDPQRGIAEAHRVLREGGTGVVIGPVEPAHPLLRRLSSTWMLFPPQDDYVRWFERAGFEDVQVHALAPDWYRGRSVYAVAVSGVKRGPARTVPGWAGLTSAVEDRTARMTVGDRLRFAGRFVLGSAAGLAFVPIGAALALRARLARR
jgi:MPBQ/MSBQ methyltransferase